MNALNDFHQTLCLKHFKEVDFFNNCTGCYTLLRLPPLVALTAGVSLIDNYTY